MDNYSLLQKAIENWVDIDRQDLTRVLSCFHPLSAKKNEIIERQGNAVRRMYFVVKGCLRIYFNKPDATEATRRFAFAEGFSTCLVSFITGGELVESAQALEESEILYISRKDFYALLGDIPAWEIFYRNYLEGAYVANTNRLQSFITLDAAERYQLLLKEDPQIVLKLSNRLVANYLNVTQEGLSRIKSRIFLPQV